VDISKPYTTRTKESMHNFEVGWDRIFKKKSKLKKRKKNGVLK
jgi:hypothetical protein